MSNYLLKRIQAEVISYWEDDPQFEISQVGVLNDFMQGDEDAASEAAIDYVASSLEDFGIPWEFADNIVNALASRL